MIAARAGSRYGMEGRLAGACLLWGVAFTGANQLLKRVVDPSSLAGWVIAIVPLVVGVWLAVAFARFLRGIDEMQRAIQLQAMALGFGGGFLAVCAYLTLQRVGAPALDTASLLASLPVFYALATVVAGRRYR